MATRTCSAIGENIGSPMMAALLFLSSCEAFVTLSQSKFGAQLAGMFERDADDEGAARGREMPPP